MFADFAPRMQGAKLLLPFLSNNAIPPKYVPTGANYQILLSDFANILIFTGSTSRTFTIPDASLSLVQVGWWCIVQNSGTSGALVTLNGGSLFANSIDGVNGLIMYPGEARLIYCNGPDGLLTATPSSIYGSIVLKGFRHSFTSTTTFTVPPGYNEFDIELIGGGGSGASRLTTGNAGGGGPGGYCRFTVPTSAFVNAGNAETVTIAGTAAGVSGVSSGTVGNVTSITINGVTYSTVAATAATSAGSSAAASGGGCGMPPLSSVMPVNAGALYNGKNNGTGTSPNATYGAGGGAVTSSNVPTAGGDSLLGPGGGGGSSSTAGGIRTGGVSLLAGAGGAGGATDGTGVGNGSIPGGGGGGTVQGATSGSGAGGRVYIIGRI